MIWSSLKDDTLNVLFCLCAKMPWQPVITCHSPEKRSSPLCLKPSIPPTMSCRKQARHAWERSVRYVSALWSQLSLSLLVVSWSWRWICHFPFVTVFPNWILKNHCRCCSKITYSWYFYNLSLYLSAQTYSSCLSGSFPFIFCLAISILW